MSDIVTREKNRTYYQEHREQILRATKEKPGKIPGVSERVLE